jgi:hypothetical protein
MREPTYWQAAIPGVKTAPQSATPRNETVYVTSASNNPGFESMRSGDLHSSTESSMD